MAKHVKRVGVNVKAEIHKKTTPLHENASKGLSRIVDSLIKTGEDINAEDENKRTPLHLRVDKSQMDVVEILLKAGAKVNAQDAIQLTPLHVAVHRGPTGIIEMLLKAGANANAENFRKLTPFHCAACSGHVDIVETLLKAGANVNAADNLQTTPLHYAALYGHAEIVKTLLKADANIDAADAMQMTPLHYASREGHLEVVEILIYAGANVKAKCDRGWTPLFYSNREWHYEVSECLRKYRIKRISNWMFGYSSALAIETESHTQSTKTVHVLGKSTDGVSRYSEYSHTSIMTCEPRDFHTDVTPSTAFAKDIQQGFSSADCVTAVSSGRTANSCTIISDDTEATTSALRQGLSLQGCEDFRKQVGDHWAKFPLQHKSNSGQCSTDVTSVLKDGNITINVVQTTNIGKAKFVNMHGKLNVIQRTEPADSDADTDDSDTNDNSL
ncbi:hypothetical protein BsWGS_26222 [Bradybaena similaris]